MRHFCPDQPLQHQQRPLASMVSATVLTMELAGPALAATPCAPCAARCAPAALNPCAAKNPCAENTMRSQPMRGKESLRQ